MAMPYDTPVPGFNNNVRKQNVSMTDEDFLLGGQHPSIVECQGAPKVQLSILFVFLRLVDVPSKVNIVLLLLVNDGDYLNAVSEQSLAENVTRVLYPNDNVRRSQTFAPSIFILASVHARQRTSSETRIFSCCRDSFRYHSTLQTFEIRQRHSDSGGL